jgi:hypothetical protein
MKLPAISAPRLTALLAVSTLGALTANLCAGPYSAALNDPTNAYDAPVPGFLGPGGIGQARLDTYQVDYNGDPIYQNPNNYVNPVFFAWANNVVNYSPSAFVSSDFADSLLALGPVTGDDWDVVSLGDLTASQISAGTPAAGSITVTLAKPIRNLTGADFVIYENGALAQSNQGGAGVGGIFGELAYVEVSDGGAIYRRFPAASLTAAAVGPYGTLNPTNLYNLAGKHTNADGNSWGTPFDLSQVGLSQITHIRIVDVPGSGAFKDAALRPIYDAWPTFGSGGFDLEAVGSISTAMTFAEWPALASLPQNQRGENDDPDGDGLPNLLEYAFACVPWVADAAGAAPTCAMVTDGSGRHAELRFLRDERLIDLSYEVQIADNLSNSSWTTIASSTAGAPVQAVAGYHPVIAETSAGSIASIGVIRRVTVRDTQPAPSSGRRFFRVKVSRLPL